jgi:bidirectional [NiFe] hydrogenase diaphorase subunit
MSPTATESKVKPDAAPQDEAAQKKKTAEADRRFKRLDITMKRHQYRADALIEVLHIAQEAFGYLEEDVLEYIAHGLKMPLSKVYGVATFYHLFSLKPGGAHTCVVCMGTACYVKGAGKVMEALQEKLGIEAGKPPQMTRFLSWRPAVWEPVALPRRSSLTAKSAANLVQNRPLQRFLPGCRSNPRGHCVVQTLH